VNTTTWLEVAVQTPAHSGVGGLLSYRSPMPLLPGQLVRVPLGRREVLGVVWQVQAQAPEGIALTAVKDIAAVLEGVGPLNGHWLKLVQFAAQYYQRSLGEVALSALPPQLRDLNPTQLARRLKKLPDPATPLADVQGPTLSEQQSTALQQMTEQAGPFLLFGTPAAARPRCICKPCNVCCKAIRRPRPC